MSANTRAHRDTPKEDHPIPSQTGPPASPPESTETVPPPQQPDSIARRHFKPAPVEMFKNDETLVKLLRAVESANLVFQLHESEPENTADPVPAPLHPQMSAASAPTFSQFVTNRPPSGPQPEAAPSLTTLQAPKQPDSLPPKSAPVEPVSIESASSEPTTSQLAIPLFRNHPVPLFSVSHRLPEYELVEGNLLSGAPAPQVEMDPADWGVDGSPFKPPAPFVDTEAPFIAKLNARLRRLAPKVGVPVTIVERFGDWIAWLWDEPVEQPQPLMDPRDRQRLLNPPLIAYYWSGGPPKPNRVADLSSSGLYLLTNDRWRPGTRISMTLVRTDAVHKSPENWLVVDFVIVRWGHDGLGGAFAHPLPGIASSATSRAVSVHCASKPVLDRFVDRLIVSSQDQPQAGASSLDLESGRKKDG